MMKGLHYVTALLLLTVALEAEGKKVVCYVGTWATYRNGDGKFEMENVNTTLCTDVIYTFAGLQGNQIISTDNWLDLPSGLNGYGRAIALKKKNPDLKVLLGIGGFNQGTAGFEAMSATADNRAEFITSVVDWFKLYPFDGLDMDWEYPQQSDKDNYVALLQELRTEFDKHGWFLSAAVAALTSTVGTQYDVPGVSKSVDFIHLMSYDYHGSWENFVNVHSPLFPKPSETDSQKILNVNATVGAWLAAGAPAKKLVLGCPAYGRSFTLTDPKETEPYSAATGAGKAGPYTASPGELGYNEIVEKQASGDWAVTTDKDYGVPYSYNGDQWVGYDDPDSITVKALYANSYGLAGLSFWSIDTEDFHGKSGTAYPLLVAANAMLNKN